KDAAKGLASCRDARTRIAVRLESLTYFARGLTTFSRSSILVATVRHHGVTVSKETVRAQTAEPSICWRPHPADPRPRCRLFRRLVHPDRNDRNRDRAGGLVPQDEMGADLHRLQPGLDHLRRLRAGHRRQLSEPGRRDHSLD